MHLIQPFFCLQKVIFFSFPVTTRYYSAYTTDVYFFSYAIQKKNKVHPIEKGRIKSR